MASHQEQFAHRALFTGGFIPGRPGLISTKWEFALSALYIPTVYVVMVFNKGLV